MTKHDALAVDGSEPQEGTDARTVAMSIWEFVQDTKELLWFLELERHGGWYVNLKMFVAYLILVNEYPSRGGRRRPVDVADMVSQWVPIIKGLSLAHDKASVDRTEYNSQEHLFPLLGAPIKQVRKFFAALVVALKADPEIPFFVWTWFEAWGELMKQAPDGQIKVLKTKLAEQVAELVEKDVQPDLRAALVGALQWRNPDTLERIKTAVEKGEKPRMRGRESCLFLEVADEIVML